MEAGFVETIESVDHMSFKMIAVYSLRHSLHDPFSLVLILYYSRVAKRMRVFDVDI